ncbi:MAG TPA: NAD(+)/NADH kinase [Gemmatimonadaceae bacterium]|nr:NAD(+)/NADH kinase [Gemmatimonadaceae bacterium]
MIRLGVIGHRGYVDAGLGGVLRSLGQIAPKLGIEVSFEQELLEEEGAKGGLLEDPASIDALLTLGGDGTLLRGARFLQAHQVPILGVNLGRLGFLTGTPVDQFEASMTRFAAGDYHVETRIALHATVLDVSGRERQDWYALNDVVLHKGGFARVVTLRVAADDETIASYAADGVVICTPTGSTAYSLSAGGPILFPTLETLLVTPVSAHALAIRPVVLPAHAVVTVQSEDGPEELLVTVDGQPGTTFATGETLSVRRAPHGIQVVRFPGSSFFTTLRQKLGWGGLPKRDQQPAC